MEFTRKTRFSKVASPLVALVSALAVSCGDSSSSAPIERRVVAEGTVNFRDAGGYPVMGGGSVRAGLLFRSDSLDSLTPAGVSAVSALDLDLIVDLRSPGEAGAAPDVAIPGVTRFALPVAEDSFDGNAVRAAVFAGDLTGYDAAGMQQGYRDLITQHGEEFVTIFERLADPSHTAIVLHCSQGKDRTGVAIALVLLALGVSEANVLEDYLLTNDYSAERNAQIVMQVAGLGITEEEMMPLLTADAAYLNAALDELENGWGDVEAYLIAHGLTEETLAQVRANLITKSAVP